MPEPGAGRGLGVVLAYVAVSSIFGSNYLALRYGLEGFPPILLVGIRFAVAGAVLYVFLRIRGWDPPTRSQWWNISKLAGLILVAGTAMTAVAIEAGVGSGLAGAAYAAVPVWAALWATRFKQRPERIEWVGVLVGFVGVIMLVQEGDFRSTALGAALMIAGPVFWALGSVLTNTLQLPKPLMTSAAQMLLGGCFLLVVSYALGEGSAAPNTRAWVALVYLITFGGVISYSAYTYLLTHVRPTTATSYAFINPLVAIILGMTIGEEVVSGPVFIALPLILIGVLLVTVARPRSPVPSHPGTGLAGKM